MTRAHVALFVILASASSAGCSNDATARNQPNDSGPGPGPADARPDRKRPPPFDATTLPPKNPTYAPTFVALFNEVLVPSCGSPFCHGVDGYYTLASVDSAYASLVGAPATSKDCVSTGLLRVAPGKPEASLLYLKVTSPPCGQRMPLQFGATGYLTSRQIAQMKRWIELGAPFDHVPDSGSEAGHPAGSADGAAPDASEVFSRDASVDAPRRDAAPADASAESG
jgi:hypothetical protein